LAGSLTAVIMFHPIENCSHPKMQQELPWGESPPTKQKFLFDATFWENDSWVD